MALLHLSIIIPAYNEARRIAPTLRSTAEYLRDQPYTSEIVVVLNNCTDNTLEVVSMLSREFPCIRYIDMGMFAHPSGTKGLAVRTGMLDAKGEYRLYMDADNATKISEIVHLWPHLGGGHTIVFGSRYVSGSRVYVSWYRKILSRVSNLFVRIVLLPGVRDTQCAFKLFSAEATTRIFTQAQCVGWAFDMEVLYLARRYGYGLREVPITWNEVGESSVKAKAVFTAFSELLRIRILAWRGKYK
jgi:dolichyl-phosphate beta-glucosyltransferase